LDVANLKKSWNTIAGHYARRYHISTDIVHYGPLCPGDDKLGILGDIAGLRILDMGCGVGQNAIALTRLGAHVTAVDFSERQIDEARALAGQCGIETDFIISDIGSIPSLKAETFDLALSVCAIAFVKDEARVFAEAFRLLRLGGRFIISDMHPLQYILDENRRGVEFNNSYPFKPIHMRWRWDFESDNKRGPVEAGFEHYVRSVPNYCNSLIAAGFSVCRILEPKPTSRTPHVGFSTEIMQEYPYIARHLPITFIIEAKKERKP
jgi:2-polyprenyl-3-methyl-5-hydroxy-6-metoxy-1,4-benzoquinol methylase